MKGNTTTYLALALGIVVGALGLASIQTSAPRAKADPQVYGRPVSGISEENMAVLRNLDASFASLAEYISPSVVKIRAESNKGQDILGRRMPAMGGEGSGVIFRNDGWIITNDHVVGGFDKVTVQLSDGREFPGKVTSAEDSDLAVIKIDAPDLVAAQFGDSSNVRAGQFAVAIGAPYGLENSVSIGHISALGRASNIPDARLARGVRVYPDLIQTDAAINMGNSGGPLVNVDGQVIGINSAIYSATGQSSGIGFAIPSNMARKIAEALISKGKVVRGALGILPENLKAFQKKELKLDGGAMVSEAPNTGPAAAAGIRKGDVIVRIGSFPVKSQTDLRMAMLDYAPGTVVTVVYVRDGERKSVDIKAADPKIFERSPAPQPKPDSQPDGDEDQLTIPEPFAPPSGGGEQNGDDAVPPVRTGKAKLGVSVQSIGKTERLQFSIPEDVAGAVIVTVAPGSVAERQGWRPGTVILQIGETKIESAADVANAMSDVEWGSSVQIKVGRYSATSRQESESPVKF